MIEPCYLPTSVPEGRSGPWAIERFNVSPGSQARESDPRPAWARCPAGRYTRLSVGRTVMMTDTLEEWSTQRRAIARAASGGGTVLVSGLGLGVVVESMLGTAGSRVEHVTVLEHAPEVIELVSPHLLAQWPGRVTVVQADAFAWMPPAGARYSVGWHDIWPNPYDAAIRVEMDRLEARYRPFCDWQGSWGRGLLPGEPGSFPGGATGSGEQGHLVC